jgi:hypothetical protein
VAVPILYQRVVLRSLMWDAEEQSTTLAAVLKSAARARVRDTQSGKVLIGTAANGKSATYQLPPSAEGMSPADIACMLGDLLDRYDEALRFLVARGVSDANSTQIFDEMYALLIPAHEHSHDFSGLPG